MTASKRADEKLRPEEISVVHDRKDLRLVVDMVGRSHPVAAGDEAESSVLDGLQSPTKDSRLNDGSPNRSGMGVRGPDESLEGDDEGPDVISPLRSLDSLKYIQTL